MTHRATRLLPGTVPVGYDRAVSAELRSLDIYTMFPQSDASLARVKSTIIDQLPKPSKSELGPLCLVDGQVLPADVRRGRYYLDFHLDKDAFKEGKVELFSSHLRYRLRPQGPIPRDLRTLRENERTAEWVERQVTSLGHSFLMVEAELILKKWRRRRPPFAVPTIQAGGASLLHCGSEYTAEVRRPDQVHRFRWYEQAPGRLSVWLWYSVVLAEPIEGLWTKQEKRCRELLEQLV